MASYTVVMRSEFAERLVLAPERYDPRREVLLAEVGRAKSVQLGNLVTVERKTMRTSKGVSYEKRYLVLDTCDAAEGILVGRKLPLNAADIGSTKKVMKPGDVIISRLRPYLRQVAYVDAEFVQRWQEPEGLEIIGSTEFFVLRSKDGEDVSFLAPYLLTAPVQGVLNASQEGGHHPRFSQETLLGLPVPGELMKRRKKICDSVKQSVRFYRGSEKMIADEVTEAEKVFT